MSLPKASVIVALHPYNGTILAVTRKGTIDDWGLVGGKVDPGEHSDEAAKREFFEETGVAISTPVHLKTDDAHGYNLYLYIVRDREDLFNIYDAFKLGHRSVEPNSLVGYVDYATLLDGSFKKYNTEIISNILAEIMRTTA